jgi:probable rRNA maturation factor
MAGSVPLAVYIQTHYPEEVLPPSSAWERWFQQWIDRLQAELPSAEAYELTLCFSDDAEIAALNAQYRQKNQPTDVLAFASLEAPLSEQAASIFTDEPLYLGDIIISVETANQQAVEQQHPLTQELAWLATHGLLHLLGWDHPDEKSLEKMLAHQETLLVISGHK